MSAGNPRAVHADPLPWPLRPGYSLRRVPPEAAESVWAVIDAQRGYLREWMPWLDAARSPRDIRQRLEEFWLAYANGQGFSLGLYAGEQYAGMIGFHAFDSTNRITSLGYWLSPAHQGEGLMTQAVARCLRYAFEARDMNRVYIRCATRNRRSRAIPERLGFVHEGTQREAEWLYDHFVDLEVYAQLAREWRARQAQEQT